MSIQRAIIECALAAYPVVRIGVVNNTPGVRLPANLLQYQDTFLDVGWDLPIPIVGLDVNEDGITGTFSFHGTPFPTVIPWDAIWSVAHPDFQTVFPGPASRLKAAVEGTEKAQKRSHLEVVK